MPKPNDVGIGTAMIVLSAQGKVLLGKRKGAHRSGCWACPGGWMDRTDLSTAAAAIRETKEEAGLIVRSAIQLCWMTEDHPEIECRTVTLYHVAGPTQWHGNVQIMEPEKCSEWKWFYLHELPKPLFPGIREALQMLQYKGTRG